APVFPGSAAEKADKQFAFDDVIVGMSDPANPAKVTPLPDDPRNPGSGMKDIFEFHRRMGLLGGQTLIIQVEREVDGKKELVNIAVPPMFHRTLAVRMKMGQITAVREDSPAAKAGIKIARQDGQAPALDGDVIEKVEVQDGRR